MSRGGHGSVNHINRTEVLKWFEITEPNRLRFETNQTEPKLWFGLTVYLPINRTEPKPKF